VRIKLKAFIEGVEIPVVSANRIASTNNSVQCYLDVPPYREVMKIVPGSHVAVFHYVKNNWVLFFSGYYIARTIGFDVNANEYAQLACIGISNGLSHAKIKYLQLPSIYGQMPGHAFEALEPDLSGFVGSETSVTDGATSITSPFMTMMRGFIDSGIGHTLRQTIRNMESYSRYFRRINRAQKITRHLAFADNKSISEVLKQEYLRNVVMNYAGYINNRGDFFELIGLFFPFIFYNWIEIPSPKFQTGGSSGTIKTEPNGVGSVVFKPHTIFSPPPKCNVVFRGQYSNFRFNSDYRSEATRFAAMARLSPLLPISGNQIYYAPRGMDKVVQQSVQDQKLKSDASIFTKEELYRGMVTDYDTIPFSESIIGEQIGNDSVDGYVNLKKAFQDYALYTHSMKKLSTRTMEITGKGLPYMVPGFPAAVIHDSNMIIVGDVLTVSDTVSINGVFQTTVNLGFCRYYGGKSMVDADEVVESISTLKAGIQTPNFFDKTFYSSEINKKVYQPLLGCDSILDDGQENIVEALEELASRYEKATDKESFSDRYNYREIVTEGEYMSLLLGGEYKNMPEDPKRRFAGRWLGLYRVYSSNEGKKPFMKERQEQVINYKKQGGKPYATR
jgi:hypothetical protein